MIKSAGRRRTQGRGRGTATVNVIGTAEELGYIDIPEGTLIDIDQLEELSGRLIVLIPHRKPGRTAAALSRAVWKYPQKVSIKPTDVIVLSSTRFRAMRSTCPRLSTNHKKVPVINHYPRIRHVRKRSSWIYALVRPKYAIHHGEYRHFNKRWLTGRIWYRLRHLEGRHRYHVPQETW